MSAHTTFLFSRQDDPVSRSDVECIALLKHTQYARGAANPGRPDFDQEWACQLLRRTEAADGKSGRIIKLENLENLPNEVSVDRLESGVDKLFIPSALVQKDRVMIPEGAAVEVEKLPTENGNRRLLKSGIKKVLVVRVKDVGGVMGTETTPSAYDLSNEIFGTYGDSMTMTSQFDDCSFGQFQLSPVKLWDPADPPLADVGVYQVDVVAPSNDRTQLQNAITDQLNEDWDFATLPEPWEDLGGGAPFDYILYCLPPGTANETKWWAYAYTNSWLSVYNNEDCNFPSFGLHELGHNIGLAHSGGLIHDGNFTECTFIC